MRLVVVAILGLSVMAAGSATAQTMPPVAAAPVAPAQPTATIVAEPAAVFIAACDQNGDARTSRAELDACVARSFARIDTANSGTIGYIGYADWALLWLGDRNALPSPFGVDANQDNRITVAELQGEFGRLFERFDLDRDGMVTRAELLTIRSGLRPVDTGKRKRKP
ncbi:EF-hand domain-containing protein [Sphingomonas sp. TREG-RG-20F-R18-01]|uniref:EF-hand domain-containing protein n=1 Tax=Sphingomonas sp. TREG-RG-20F-R18-01 TaxID=2914982 RepID=UPI001F5655F7|nr:EF-hand domain-containing protein [Sphingomonas sp. TREG-RG-20F-R18-01]